MTATPTVAVVVCAYTERRWDDLVSAYRSLLTQTRTPDEIVVVIDHNPDLLARFAAAEPAATVIANTGDKGLSGARNTGVAATRADVVMFLDDDAVASPGWLAALMAPLDDPAVLGVAGWADPEWGPQGGPDWFPAPFLWVVGCSYEGLPTTPQDVRNPLGCAMGFRRTAMDLVGGFSGSVGRVGTHPVGCEETEFSIRLRQLEPTTRIVMVPDAVVRHRVSADRHSPRYFFSRCYWEGVSKAVVSSAVGSQDALESERAYTTKVLPRAFGRGLTDLFRGRPAGVLRSAAIVAGLICTTAGFLRGRVAKVNTTARPHLEVVPAAPVSVTERRETAA